MTRSEEGRVRGDFIYEPEPEEILERLLPVYLETEIYRAFLESAASFLAAQMTAMRNASKNAGELIDRYTLQMNRARQAQITQEILEIVAGADALAVDAVTAPNSSSVRPSVPRMGAVLAAECERARTWASLGARRGAVAVRAGTVARARRALRRVRRLRAATWRADAGAPPRRSASSAGRRASRRHAAARAAARPAVRSSSSAPPQPRS